MQAHGLLSDPAPTGLGYLTTDDAGRISSLGKGLAATLGRSSAELLGSPLTGLFPPDQVAPIQDAAREAALRSAVSLKTTCRMSGLDTDVVLSCHAADGPAGAAIWQIEPLETTEAGRRADWANAVAVLNEVMSRTHERSALAASACRAAATEGAMRMAWIGVIDPQTGAVTALARSGHEDGYLAEAVVDVNGERAPGPTREAIETGVMVVSRDIARDARMAPWRKAALARGYAAWAAVPLFVEGRPMGALNLYSAEAGAFSPGERDAVLDFAARISLGLDLIAQEEGRRAVETALRSKLRQQASIAALGAVAIAADTPGALFHDVARRIASTLEVELVRVMEAVPEGSKLVTRGAVGFDAAMGWEVTADEDPVAGFAVRQGPIIVRDLGAEGYVSASMLAANGVVSGLEVPIASPAGPIGLVGAFSRSIRQFTDEDAMYLKAVSALVGVAVARMRAEDLYRQKVRGERDRSETRGDDLEKEVAERTAELKAAVDELESFTYSVSHDLRAPLRAVRGFAGILLEEQATRLDEEGIRQLHVIADSAERMGHLIDDLLSLCRIGRREPNLVSADLNGVADDAIEICKRAHPGHPGLVRRSDLGRAIVDPGLFSHLFMNLIDNAFKFTSKRRDPVIEIGLADSPEPGEVVVYVRDDGAGFDPRHIDQLFQPFHRLHQEREFPGTGIGLAVVARVAQKVGGRVWAEGEPDRGATFFVALKKGNEDG